MHRTLIFPLIILIILLVSISCSDNSAKKTAKVFQSDWRYFGQQSPESTPQLFLPEIISTSRNERDFAMSPSGTELFYSFVLPAYNMSTIVTLRHDGAFWSDAHVAGFSGKYKDLEPAFSPDGSKLYFISQRPLNTQDKSTDWNIWYVEKISGKWSNPKDIGMPVNTEGNEFYPGIGNSGNLYFTAKFEDSFGEEDIYMSVFKDGKYSDPINLGESVNTEFNEFNSYISPEEDFILFSSVGRDDGSGGGDLYISVKGDDQNWKTAVNLGANINSDKLDYCPFVTYDKKYLFFTSLRTDPDLESHEKKSLEKVQQLDNSIRNGLGNIYWVAFDIQNWKK